MAIPKGLRAGLRARTVVKDGKKEVEYTAHISGFGVVYRRNGKAIKALDVPEEVKNNILASMYSAAKEEELLQSVPEELTEEPLEKPDDLGFEPMKFDLSKAYDELLEAYNKESVLYCNLKTLIDTLYERFKIYTCYLNRAPEVSDIHPITGQTMNMFVLGQTNQQFKVAQRDGSCNNPAVIRSMIDGAKAYIPQMSSKEAVEDGSVMLHARGQEGDGLDPDEVYAEPPINGSFIRPWSGNKKAMAQLEGYYQVQYQPSATLEDLI